MTDTALTPATNFVLPPAVVTKADVARLVSEMESLDNLMTTESVRESTGAAALTAPSLSPAINAFFTTNSIQLGDSHSRTQLIGELRKLKDTVPVLHLTFAVEADSESLQAIVSWLRSTIHPHAVIGIGLQPGLVAGVYLRTPNHVHDLSLRAAFKGGHDKLKAQLEALRVNS